MAEDFHSGNWWNSVKNNTFSSPCTAAAAAAVVLNDGAMGNFGWCTAETVDINATRSSDESASSIVSDSSSIHVFPDTQKPPPLGSTPTASGAGGVVLLDSTLQMMGFNLSSSSTSPDWNPALRHGSGRGEVNFHSILQEDTAAVEAMTTARLSNYPHHQQQKGWSVTNNNTATPPKYLTNNGDQEDSTLVNSFKPINLNQSGFGLDQHRLLGNQVSSSGDCAAASFPMMSPTSYVYPTTTLLQNMVEIDPQSQQSSLYYPSTTTMTSTNMAANFNTNTNESTSPSSWPNKFSHPILKPSLPKMQQTNHFHLSNNTTFWNASSTAAAATAGLTDIRGSFFNPQPQLQFLAQAFEEKPILANLAITTTTKPNSTHEVKKSGSESLFKRPRIETPSPLPAFKVRKEKLGDRITALQQLVSPFGKTDTASVLHEAIDYIKFLHDQVLSTPYMKNGAPIQYEQATEKLKEAEGPKQDLRSRGLSLVPISSTFPVANESSTEFWNPTFGGIFR